MFSIFKRSKNVDKTPVSSGHKSARDMNTTAIHIEKIEGKPLCGTTRALYGDSEVTVKDVVNSAPNQHAGWHWCPECASRFTTKQVSFFTDSRKK